MQIAVTWDNHYFGNVMMRWSGDAALAHPDNVQLACRASVLHPWYWGSRHDKHVAVMHDDVTVQSAMKDLTEDMLCK